MKAFPLELSGNFFRSEDFGTFNFAVENFFQFHFLETKRRGNKYCWVATLDIGGPIKGRNCCCKTRRTMRKKFFMQSTTAFEKVQNFKL